MVKHIAFLVFGLILISFSIWRLIHYKSNPDDFTAVSKLALRDVGNQLLLAYNDSTSVVKPVIEQAPFTFKLSFQNELAIVPDSLVAQMTRSIGKANLPSYYRVEVIQCSDNEIAYSYEMRDTQENGIVPCGGRIIKEGCYVITVLFLSTQEKPSKSPLTYYLLLIAGLSFVIPSLYNRKTKSISKDDSKDLITLGSFYFYPDQNKLVKHPEEITLSKKECEILALFVERPNQIIKREELTKAVWEDNGVIVGRSLDTYISKLRKKLQADESIKLTNVHGVGYKLEIDQN